MVDDAGQRRGPARRPNVLFVICDQLRADHLGYAGNRVVRTPHIDALAASGTVFDRAHVNNPVCMPNRSTIMTGRMPSAHGVIFNDRSLEPSVTTFVGRLRDAGWRTALIGKSHLQHGESRNAVADLGKTPGRTSPFNDGWDTIEHDERYERGEVVAPDDFYGFGEIDLTLGHGAQVGAHHYQWARRRGIAHDVLRAGLDPDSPIPSRRPEWWQLHPAPYPEEIHSTNFVTERTIDFIERAEAAETPWMAWCSYPDPHHPLAPPEPWFARHDPGDIELPSTFDDPGEDWAPHLQLIRSLRPGRRAWVAPFGPTPELTRAAIAVTYGMIEYIDAGVGRIMATLDRLGASEDTIVVFTSDHGDMMGDHGLMLKLIMHFQGCLRVPLIVKAPGRSPSRTDALAASIDLPHTLLDLCGIEEYQGMQGTSLVPLLDDPAATVRDAVLIEEDFPMSETGAPFPIKTRTTVTATHRYSRDSDGFEMLYDLEHDPDELVNLAVGDRDRGARIDALDAMFDQMLRADDITRTEPVFELTEAAMGFVPRSMFTMGRNPALLRAFAQLAGTVLGPGRVDGGLKQLVAHVASTAAGCRYCQAHTASTATRNGVDPSKVEAVWNFDTDDRFTDAERSALRLARDAASVPNATTAAHFDDLSAHFDQDQIVELVAVISLFGWLNRWNDTMATDLEDEPLGFGRAHLAAQGWEPGKHVHP